MISPRLIVFFVLGSFTAIVLACITAAFLVAGPAWWSIFTGPPETSPVTRQVTPAPTFTATSSPQPLTAPPTPWPEPSPTSPPTATPPPTETPVIEETPVVEKTAPLLPTTTSPPQSVALAEAESPTPAPAGVDFVVARQRMRSNAENSWEEVIANGCGSDHTIYVTVLDAAGNPLNSVLVGDSYDNVRAASGSAGPGKLEIELWSNTMILEVKQNIEANQTYTSEQTLPLSAKDEDIPTEWLFEGGYCASLAECELRQQTNGLCRGHYSYEVTFQRTW